MIFCEIAKIFGNKKAPKKYIILGAFLLGWRGRKRIRRGTFRFADWNILFRNAGTFRFADYNLWHQKDLGEYKGGFWTQVPYHGVTFVKKITLVE